jgi:hypothetical protein
LGARARLCEAVCHARTRPERGGRLRRPAGSGLYRVLCIGRLHFGIAVLAAPVGTVRMDCASRAGRAARQRLANRTDCDGAGGDLWHPARRAYAASAW